MGGHEWMVVGGGDGSEVWRLLLIRGDLVLGGLIGHGVSLGVGPAAR